MDFVACSEPVCCDMDRLYIPPYRQPGITLITLITLIACIDMSEGSVMRYFSARQRRRVIVFFGGDFLSVLT